MLLTMATFSYGQNLISNGSFPNTSVWFSTNLPTASSQGYTCPTVNTYMYCIVGSGDGWSSAADHTPGGGTNMMKVDGRGSSSDANLVWGYTAAVSPSTTYDFSFWVHPRNSSTYTNKIDIQIFFDDFPKTTFELRE